MTALPGFRIRESAFTAQVIELAHVFGWMVAHFRPAWTSKGWRTPVQGDGVGFPDLIILRGTRGIAAELKQDGKHCTEAQRRWIDAFRHAGFEVYEWHPREWDEIRDVLAGGSDVAT